MFRNRVYRDADSCMQRYVAGYDVPCIYNSSCPVDEYRTRFFGLGKTNNFIVMPVRYAPHIRTRAIKCVDLVAWNQMPFREGSKTRMHLEKKKELNAVLAQYGPPPLSLSIPPHLRQQSTIYFPSLEETTHLLCSCNINFYIQLNSINRSNPGHNPQSPLGPRGLEGTPFIGCVNTVKKYLWPVRIRR